MNGGSYGGSGSHRRQVAAKDLDADQRNNNGRSGKPSVSSTAIRGRNLQQPRSPFSVADGRIRRQHSSASKPCALLCCDRGSKPTSGGGGCAEKPGGVLPSVALLSPFPVRLEWLRW
nr:hypothetical protein Itr_chr05CG14240 [Ipomoea trifida]GLL27345.1 hypothetical protein Itr_chr05CG14250 [Ipomoea trifida]